MSTKLPHPLALWSVVAALALTSGCQTPVDTHVQPTADFTRYRTFDVIPLTAVPTLNDPGMMLELAKPAQDATVAALTSKGYRQAERSQADFVVNLRGESLPRVEVTDLGFTGGTWTPRSGYIPAQPNQADARFYDERTLTVEIYDNHSRELVWAGSTTKETTGRIDPERLKEAIHTILGKFPTASGAGR